jgi:hypothetical protein
MMPDGSSCRFSGQPSGDSIKALSGGHTEILRKVRSTMDLNGG